MKTRKTLWFTLFIVCSLALVSGSEIDSAAPAAPELLQSTDVQVNWSGGDVYPYTTQSETTIQVNPNTGTICVAYNDLIEGASRTGHSRSTDGGATFVDGGSFPDGPGATAGADPSLAWRAKDGFFYYTAISSPGPTGIWRSTDDCETFSHLWTFPQPDREMMVIDNNPDSDYYGRIYIAFTGGNIFHSIEDPVGVITWSDIVSVNPDGFAPWPAVDPVTGDVYIAWRHLHTDYEGFMDIEITRSTDGGETWDTFPNPVSFAINPYDKDASDDCGKAALNGHIRHPTAPQIVVDSYNHLHVVYARDPDGAEVGDVINVYYRRSTNQGLTWGPEVLLNDDATNTDQWFPTVSVGPTGTVVATWYDRRNDPDNNFEYDYYMAISLDNGVTWEPNIRVSDVSSKVADVYPANFNPGVADCYHGDYDQQVQEGAFAYIVWSDDRNILNAPPEPHYDPDVWFDKVLVTPELYHPIYLPLVIRHTQSLGNERHMGH